MVTDLFDYDPVPFQSAGKMKVRYKMSECDNTADAGEARCSYCGKRLSSHISGCPFGPPETPVVHHVYGLDEPTRKMIEQLLAGNLERLAGRVIGLLRKILEGQQKMATTLADFQELGTKFDTDLTAVTTGVTDLKTQIQALKDQLATGGMSAADEATAKELMASKEAALAAAAALFAPTP